MISFEEERQRPYFVDNDFFNNKYNISTKLRYFCIRVRDVTDWEKYSEEKEICQSNIIYFNGFSWGGNSISFINIYIKHCTKSKFCANRDRRKI